VVGTRGLPVEPGGLQVERPLEGERLDAGPAVVEVMRCRSGNRFPQQRDEAGLGERGRGADGSLRMQ